MALKHYPWKGAKKVFNPLETLRVWIALHLKISLYHRNWTFSNAQGKPSLSWCSLYFHRTSFIYSNGPTISHYIHENHQAERVQTFFKSSVLIYNSSLHFFFFFCFCSRPWTVLAVVLQNDKYLKLALWISLWYKQRSFLWLCNPGLATEQAQPFVQFKDVNRIFIPHIFYVDGVWTNQIFILSVLCETKLVFRHINF